MDAYAIASPLPAAAEIFSSMKALEERQHPIPILALIDSDASDCFLDPSVLVQQQLQPLPHPLPTPLELIDGSIPSTGPVTLIYPSHLRIHRIHTEHLTCHVMQLGHFKLILGFPWLTRHNPCINWQAGQCGEDP